MRVAGSFPLRSLRTRIIVVVMVVVVSTTVSMLVYEQRALVKATTKAQEESARNLVNAVTLSVGSQYASIRFHERASLDKRKAMLRSALSLAMSQVTAAYELTKSKKLGEAQAKARAMTALRRMRYDHGVGYFWINSAERPTPRMVMHALIPELEGKLLDAPRFNCALGRNENLFRAMVDVCSKKGAGYVDYLWPKPTRDGRTARQPKLSYVRLFRPWGWIVGTGLYIDDIERDKRKRVDAVVQELRESFSRIKVAQTGYMFLFTGKLKMLVHPSHVGADYRTLPNPDTGNPVLLDLKAASQSPRRKLEYVFDKPPTHKGQFRFRKVAFVQHFAPLDWYIASSVYLDEMERPIKALRTRIMILGAVLLFVSLLLSLWLSRNLAQPLMHLSRAARKIQGAGGTRSSVPVSGTVETRELGLVLNGMIGSLQDEIADRREAEATLIEALAEKDVLLREVHHRVKNNLAVVVSLLSMQSRRVEGEHVRLALEESRNRIQAMALIHETLYRSDGLARIQLHDYLKTVFRALYRVMMQSGVRVGFEVTGDTVELSIEQAVPCGLALNELITNTLKYGYPEGGGGTIRIEAEARDDGWLVLDYRDDGVGLPAALDPRSQETLGMRIVHLLVEKQLNGRLTPEEGPGAHFRLSWPWSDKGEGRGEG